MPNAKKTALKMDPIPRHLGDQLEIEEILSNGGTIHEHHLENLPECSQRTEYARHSFRNAMESSFCFCGIDAALFLPEEECAECLEKIFQKSISADRWDWAEMAASAFPECEKYKSKRIALLEDIIKRHLHLGSVTFAKNVAQKIPRELTLPELEGIIADCLFKKFPSALLAKESIPERSFSIEELRIAISGAKESDQWTLVLTISQLFPSEHTKEAAALVDEALQFFISKGDASGIDKVCKIQGNRKPSTDELKAIFKKECLGGAFSHINIPHYAKELLKNSENIAYLEDMTETLIKAKLFHISLEIALVLPQSSTRKISLLEDIGKELFSRKSCRPIEKCANALPEKNAVRNKLAEYLVSEVTKEVGTFDAITDGENVLKALGAVKLLSKSDAKTKHLLNLYKSAKKIEDGFDRRDDLDPSGFYEVQEVINASS